jgi:hypothetical protein
VASGQEVDGSAPDAPVTPDAGEDRPVADDAEPASATLDAADSAPSGAEDSAPDGAEPHPPSPDAAEPPSMTPDAAPPVPVLLDGSTAPPTMVDASAADGAVVATDLAADTSDDSVTSSADAADAAPLPALSFTLAFITVCRHNGPEYVGTIQVKNNSDDSYIVDGGAAGSLIDRDGLMRGIAYLDSSSFVPHSTGTLGFHNLLSSDVNQCSAICSAPLLGTAAHMNLCVDVRTDTGGALGPRSRICFDTDPFIPNCD